MSPADACIDLIIEPSLEGGRLMAVEHAPTEARLRLRAALREMGWSLRWLRPSHYSSAAAAEWVRATLWHSARLDPMGSDETIDAAGLIDGLHGSSRSRHESYYRAKRQQRAKSRQKTLDAAAASEAAAAADLGGGDSGAASAARAAAAAPAARGSGSGGAAAWACAWRRTSFGRGAHLVADACAAAGSSSSCTCSPPPTDGPP